MTFKQTLAAMIVGAAITGTGIWGYGEYRRQENASPYSPSSSLFSEAKYNEASTAATPMVDFEKAATKAGPAVVHIRTLTQAKEIAGRPDVEDNPFRDFFGQGSGDNGSPLVIPQQRASGSGVLISADGYIVTNNHVVDHANEVTVTLNNKEDYKAKVVGTDASSDLAVIKIEAKGLPYLTFANSDNIHLGQWVLAIGYPLDLETTVTSGIVSAKSRTIGINGRNSNTPVESFIQTDAAVNPGNSGGALVNTEGDVIGINSAIASPTGSYAGYSYAIPSNLVQKVASDIIKFGSSKRAYLGVMFPNDKMSEDDRQKNDIKEGAGVYVLDVAEGSAAKEAGIQKGDFITKLNNTMLNTGTEMVEKISAMRPGDKVNISYQHNGEEKNATVTLKGETGAYASVKDEVIDQLGATFQPLNSKQAAQLNVASGVIVKTLGDGILSNQTRINEGFIVTKVNDSRVSSVEDLKDALKQAGNSALISGIYPDSPGTQYQYALNDLNAIQ